MRIYIIGVSGSGKSTLAKQLAHRLDYPHIELDEYRFLPGWIKRSEDEFIRLVKEKTNIKNWITCGNEDSSLQDYLMTAADKIIWLDYSLLLILYRTFTRTLKRIILKQPCCNGNFETFYQQFLSDKSVLWWVIKTYKKRKQEYTVLTEAPMFCDKVIRITSSKEVDSLTLKLI